MSDCSEFDEIPEIDDDDLKFRLISKDIGSELISKSPNLIPYSQLLCVSNKKGYYVFGIRKNLYIADCYTIQYGIRNQMKLNKLFKKIKLEGISKIVSVALGSLDTQVIVGTEDNQILFFDAKQLLNEDNNKPIDSIKLNNSSFIQLVLNNPKQSEYNLVLLKNRQILLFNQNEEIWKKDEVFAVNWTYDGTQISIGNQDCSLAIYDLKGNQLKTIKPPNVIESDWKVNKIEWLNKALVLAIYYNKIYEGDQLTDIQQSISIINIQDQDNPVYTNFENLFFTTINEEEKEYEVKFEVQKIQHYNEKYGMILVLGFNYYTDIKLIGCQNEDSKFYSLELDENNCINLPMMKGEELKLVQLQIDFNNHYKIPNLSNDLDDTNGMPIVLVLNSSGRLQSYDMLSSEFCSNPELKSKLMQHYNDKRNQLLFDYEKFEKKIISIESMNTHSDDDDNESEEEEQEVIEEKVKEVGEETIEEAIKEVSDEDHEEEEIGSEIQRMKIDDYFKKEIKKGIKAVQPNLVKKEEGAFVLEEEVKDDINDIEDYLKSKGLDLFNDFDSEFNKKFTSPELEDSNKFKEYRDFFIRLQLIKHSFGQHKHDWQKYYQLNSRIDYLVHKIEKIEIETEQNYRDSFDLIEYILHVKNDIIKINKQLTSIQTLISSLNSNNTTTYSHSSPEYQFIVTSGCLKLNKEIAEVHRSITNYYTSIENNKFNKTIERREHTHSVKEILWNILKDVSELQYMMDLIKDNNDKLDFHHMDSPSIRSFLNAFIEFNFNSIDLAKVTEFENKKEWAGKFRDKVEKLNKDSELPIWEINN